MADDRRIYTMSIAVLSNDWRTTQCIECEDKGVIQRRNDEIGATSEIVIPYTHGFGGPCGMPETSYYIDGDDTAYTHTDFIARLRELGKLAQK